MKPQQSLRGMKRTANTSEGVTFGCDLKSTDRIKGMIKMLKQINADVNDCMNPYGGRGWGGSLCFTEPRRNKAD